MKYTTDQWIQIVGIVASLIISIASVVIATIAIVQNSKAAKQSALADFNATRPYVSAYCEVIAALNGSMDKFLVIKNFGRTPAHIEQISYKGDLGKLNSKMKLASLENFTLAPGMSIQAAMDDDLKTQVVFIATYHDQASNEFREEYTVNFDYMSTVLRQDHHNSALSKDADAVVNELHRITQQLHA